MRDEGGLKNLKVHVHILEEELGTVNKMVVEGEERTSFGCAEPQDQFEASVEPKILQTQTVPERGYGQPSGMGGNTQS